jgi:nitroimidazol reductase NimA-like FMN-containing flavoprotein (pyridoxamine 5'-phosphate oxidase superfamily)
MTSTGAGEAVGREPEMEELPEGECYRLLRASRLGRVVLVARGRPEVFPVNYAVHEQLIAFRTGPGTKLLAEVMWAAAFEVDGIETHARVAWSVIVHGVAHEVEPGSPTSDTLWELLPETLAPGAKSHWITIHPTEVTGRRFHLRS